MRERDRESHRKQRQEEIAELNQTINEMRSCWETTQVGHLVHT